MDDLGRQVAEKLTQPFADAVAPPDLEQRILRRVTRRKRLLAVASATAAVVLVVTPIAVLRTVMAGPAPQPAAIPGHTSTAVTGPSAELEDFIEPRSVVRIVRRIPGAPPFEAKALGPDGTVLGVVERGSGEQPIPATGVWRVRPGNRGPQRAVALPSDRGAFLWTMAASERGYLWPNAEELHCLAPGAETPTRLSASWGGRSPFYADGPAFVWTEGDDTVAVSEGCGRSIRRIQVRGALVAFSYPDAFVQSGVSLRRLDIRSSEIRDVPGARVPEDAEFAADPATLAWTDGSTVVVQDRRTGRTRQVLAGLSGAQDDQFHRLSVGGRFVVYSYEHQDDSGASAATVYDLRTGRKTELPGHAWISRDRLLWRDGDNYQLARVRQ